MAFKPADGQKRISFVPPDVPRLAVPSGDGRGSVARLAFQPTFEQQDIREAFATGEDVAVIALAGTGKTTTLNLLARDHPRRRMTYVAFNRAIADEAQRRFPSNVVARTMHSFAFAAIGRHYADRLNGARVPAWKAANILRIPERFEYGTFSLRSHQLARLALEAVQRFCHSDAPEPSRSHIPKVTGMDSPEARDALTKMLYPYVVAAWNDLSGQTGQLRFTHDVYLKLWAMGNPVLPGEVVLADEAQDFDSVIKQIVEMQGGQKTYVGDNHQQIYEWRGSIDALSSFQAAHRLPLQQSFRFGPRIAAEANRILEILESPLRIVGNDNKDSQLAILDDPDCVLTRTNSEAIARLMAAQVAGVRAGLVGGTAQVEALAQAALDLTNGRKTTHHELLAFDNWGQVREYVVEDSDAKELQMLVKLVDLHGAEVLLDAVQRAVPEHSAQLVISTAHKAKGREWNRVTIAGDFQDPCDEETGEWNKGELRLAYVAITRGKDYLDCSNLYWLTDYALDSNPEGEGQTFLPPSEVPARVVVEVAPAPTEQLICDPEDATRLMFCRTPYNPELVEAQKKLSRNKFYSLYCGEEKVRVVLATQQALAVAEQFHLSVSDEARARVATLAG
jgi:superfamily I DNA/RNA helicase